jgi:hypothetical protein
MPIERPEPPDDVLQAARRAGEGLRPPKRGLRARVARAPAPPASVESPQRAFALGLDALAESQPLAQAAQPTGWRFLIEEARNPVAAAEVHDSTRAAVPAQVTRGAFVQSMADGLRQAEDLPPVREASFESRMLRIPALHVVAIWLHADGRDDVVVPLDPAPPPLEAGRSYAEPEFVEVASGMAREALAANQAAERPDELGA